MQPQHAQETGIHLIRKLHTFKEIRVFINNVKDRTNIQEKQRPFSSERFNHQEGQRIVTGDSKIRTLVSYFSASGMAHEFKVETDFKFLLEKNVIWSDSVSINIGQR